MPTRTPLALAVAALSLASAGNALAGDPRQIDVVSGVWPSQSPAGAVDGNRSITIHGHRTETVDATPADRDVQLKGRKILQNAPAGPGTQEAYLQYRLKPARITSYSMSGDAGTQPDGGKALQNADAHSPVGDSSIARRARITLHSHDLDRPSANPHPTTAKYEDITLVVGAGMTRAPAAPDWTKTQGIRASQDLAPTPGSALLPALQKVREAAARMSSELTAEERAAYVGGNQSTTVGAAQSGTLGAGTPSPTAAWYAKFDGVDGSRRQDGRVRTAPKGEQHFETKLEDVIVARYVVGGSGVPVPPPQALKAETPAPQKYMEFKLKEVLISGVIQNGNHAPSAPLAPMTSVPQRPPVPDGTSSTLMPGERTLRLVPGAPGVRR
jgi:type VI protein secretion system component Hcp